MNNIFAFHGSDHKCGTSMIAQSVAEAIASKEKDLRILLVHAAKETSDAFAPNVCESFDSIRPYLVEKLVDMEDLLQKSRYKENLHIIGGVKTPGMENILPEMSEYLLMGAANLFDIVICDSGCEVDFGLSLGALFMAEAVYMVVTQSESAIRHYEYLTGLYNTMNLPVRRLLINKYSRNAVNSKAVICQRLNYPPENVMQIPESLYGDKAEFEGRTIYQLKDSKFRKEIDVIAKDIMQRAGYGNF